jgi:hypothetical protein
VRGVLVGGIAVDQLPEGGVGDVLGIGVPRDRLGEQAAQGPAPRVHRIVLRHLLEPAGVLAQLLPDLHRLELLVDHDEAAAELVAVHRLERVVQVLVGHLDPVRRQLPQRQGRVDDVAGVLHGADPALLLERAEPGLAADVRDAAGDVVDLLVDLGGGDLELPGLQRLLDELAVDQRVEDLLPLAGDALVGELLAADRLAIDDGDRVGGIDGYLHHLELGRDFLLVEGGRRRLVLGGRRLGLRSLRLPGQQLGPGRLGPRRPQRRQGQHHPPDCPRALPCDHRQASPSAFGPCR